MQSLKLKAGTRTTLDQFCRVSSKKVQNPLILRSKTFFYGKSPIRRLSFHYLADSSLHIYFKDILFPSTKFSWCYESKPSISEGPNDKKNKEQNFTGHCNLLCITCRYTVYRKYPWSQLQSADFFLRCFLFTWCFCHCNKPLVFCLVAIPLLLYCSVCWCARAISSVFCGLLKSIYKKAGFKTTGWLIKMPTYVQRYCLCIYMYLQLWTLNLPTHCP